MAHYALTLLILTWFFFLFVFKNYLLRHPFIEVSINTNRTTVANYNFVTPETKKNSSGTHRGKIRKYHVPKFMLELYENSKGEKAAGPDVVRSLIPKHSGSVTDVEKIEEFSDNHLLIFDLPEAEDEEQFVGAELRILTLIELDSIALTGIERQIQISVFDDYSNSYVVEKIHVYHMNNTWLSFNITEPVSRILQTNITTKFLKIVVSVCCFLPNHRKPSKNFKLSLMPLSDTFEHDYPILLMSYLSSNKSKKESTDHRKKRNAEEDYEEETNRVWDDNKPSTKKGRKMKNSCRRKPLYIDFSEINFDLWIVQPPGYEAYQCQGKCFYPVAEHLKPTQHAIVQALLHSVSPSKASRSCCVPTHLDSISILYIDSNGVLTYRYAYKDMVVVECGCR